MYDITVEELRAERDAGEFTPKKWNWCVSRETRAQADGGYTWEWGVWIMGACAQCYGIIWCSDESEARAVCREFGIEKPQNGVC